MQFRPSGGFTSCCCSSSVLSERRRKNQEEGGEEGDRQWCRVSNSVSWSVGRCDEGGRSSAA